MAKQILAYFIFVIFIFCSLVVIAVSSKEANERLETADRDRLEYGYSTTTQISFASTSSSSSLSVKSSEVCDFEKWRKLVNCSDRNLTSIPDDIPHDTEILYLSVNLIFRLRRESFANLSRLRELYVDHTELNDIESSTFENLENLEILDLSGNWIKSLPSESFVTNSMLTELNLGNNMFGELPCAALLPLTRLKKLLFFLNQIQSPYCERFPTLSNGSTVSLSRNNIRVVNRRAVHFLENSTLYKLNLRGNNIEYIDYRVAATLKVYSLDLSFNFMYKLGIASLFYGVRLNDMLRSIGLRSALMYNTIDPTIFTYLENKTLDYMDLSMNNMKNMRGASHLRHLRNLSLADNPGLLINSSDFREMVELEGLSLEHNDILDLKSLGIDSWSMSNLRTLNLARNRLVSVPSNAFMGLTGLTNLDLHSNPINYMQVQAFRGLHALQVLDLSETLLTSVSNGTLQFVPNLRSLNFRNAKLVFGHPRYFLQGLDKLEVIDLSGNDLRALDLWNEYFKISLFSGNYNLKQIWLDGNNHIENIPSNTFQNLTALSSLFLNDCGLTTIHMNLFRDLVNLTSLSFDTNSVSELHPLVFSNLQNLETLSASGNSITSLSDGIFANTESLQYITLPNNAITIIHGDALAHLSRLRVLDIRGNPLACTCALESFSDWLGVTNASLIGQKETLCSPASFDDLVNEPVVEFIPSDFCGPNIALYTGVSILVILFLVTLAVSYHYRYWIRYKLFLLKLCVVGYRVFEARDADDHEYYLNVMFTDGDEPWIHDHLKPVVREKFPDKDEHRDMVFGDDDLIPGMYYLEAVDYMLVHSYKTILVLSYKAIRDEWFTTKFRLALEHVNETQLEKVIIIFLEDIEDKDMPFLVRAFLSKNKPYLRWTDDDVGQQYFWEELLKSLKVNVRCDHTIPV